MTLNTELRILTPLADMNFVRELHRRANEVMGLNPKNVKFNEKPARVESWGHVEASIDNEPGQGFPAWLMLSYRLGTDPIDDYDPNDPDIDEEDIAWAAKQPQPCHAKLSYDTAYSYRDDQGDCGALHARLLAQLGAWLDERGILWAVQNEFTGDWYQGERRYEGLMSLITGGQEAASWFRNRVQPAIMLEALKRGQRIDFS